eukprot:12956015-Ditylum_brightwellii.AAC.1
MSEKDLKDLLCVKGHNPSFLLAAQPQSINAVSTFSKQVASVCLNISINLISPRGSESCCTRGPQPQYEELP